MKDWNFDFVADNFDAHVREQLPWYELITDSVAFIARNYLPECGKVYDVGASTGNMAKALRELILERNASIIAVEKHRNFFNYLDQIKYEGFTAVCDDARQVTFQEHDVAILFLTALFIPAPEQDKLIAKIYNQIRHGGVMIIVDKVTDGTGYFATVMKRLTLFWKLKNGAHPEDILKKELSLSGIQRPIAVPAQAKQFFQLGEFRGWIIEKSLKIT